MIRSLTFAVARRVRARAGAGALAVLSLGVLPGCTRGRAGLPAEAGRDLGATSAPMPDPWPYLALARAIVDGRGRDAVPAPPQAPGRRVFLVLWGAREGATEPPPGATATGPSLADAVAAAASSLTASLAGRAPAGTGRIEIDVTRAAASATLDEDTETPLASIGLEGLLATRDDGKTGFVLPGEVVQAGAFHAGKQPTLDHVVLGGLVAQRAGLGTPDLPSMRLYRFGAHAFVESPARDRALPLVRGMVEHPPQVTPDALIAAVRRGADYLSRVLDDAGRYVYLYHPADDRNDPSYGWLRHAGATYALLEAYEELGTPLYLEKAERALAYLERRFVSDASSQGKYILDTSDEEQQKVGGAGLSLLAFAKHAAVTGSRAHLDTMRALARFIVAQQYEDGHFRSNADLEASTGKKLKREPVYYPGEAALALLRLYAVDPSPAYLDAARRAVDWVARVRDANVSEDNQEHDHWIAYACNDLYRLTRDGVYLEHAFKVARAILKKQHRAAGAPAPDWAGTFYEGQSTPAATRVEAYDADVSLARFAGRPDAWILDPAREVAAWMLGQQFDEADDYWLKNPARAEGGVRESLYVQDVRIDYVQHAMSAWLHLARSLRDPAYGATGVPSQDPVRAIKDGS